MAYSEVASITISDAYVGSSNSTNFPTLFRSPVGTVNTVATAVTQESGDSFQSWMTSININGTVYGFTYVTATTGTLGSSAGTQTGVAYCGTPQLATVANGGYVQNTASLTVGARTYTVPTDLVFSSDNLAASLYSWEIETWNSATGAIVAWITIPTLSHTANTVYYVSVGNASVTTFQGGSRGAVWDSNFQGIYHLTDGTTLYGVDSTSNANDGTVSGATATTGEIDGAGAFSGSSQDISMGNVFNLGTGALTIEAWIEPPNSNQSAPIAAKRNASANYQQYDFLVGYIDSIGNQVSGKVIGWFEFDGTFPNGFGSYRTTSNVVDGNWHHVVVTRDGSGNILIYVDGASVAVTTVVAPSYTPNSDNTSSFYIGYNDTTYFNSNIDETRVSNVARSADWITAEYNNQATPLTFYSMSNFAPPPSSSTNRNFLMLMGAGT